MAKTIFTKTSDGVQSVYSIDFDLGYLDDTAYVFVYTGSDHTTQLAYTWASPTSITLNPVPANGVEFYIRRVVPRHSLINDFKNGAILREAEIDNSFLQVVMLFEEIEDGFMAVVSPWVVNGDVDMAGNSILNLDAIQAADIKNVAGDSLLAIAQASADASAVSATASADSASDSAGSASTSSTSATESATSAAEAVVSAAAALATEVRVAGAENTMGEVHFFANMRLNRSKFAGSGFVAMGKHHSSSPSINEGLYEQLTANAFFTGRLNSPVGNSRTDTPLVNVGGVLLNVQQASSNDGYLIKFPDAPDGTDRVINGAFATDTSWDKVATTISGGVANIATAGVANPLGQIITTEAGQRYIAELEITAYTSGDFQIDVNHIGGGSDQSATLSATGVLRLEFTAETTQIDLQVKTPVASTASIDNFSLIAKAELSRQDLALLEVWHEKIAVKDWVVPHGCVQSGLTSLDGVTLTNSVGNPVAGYSAFGAWEAAPVVGYGAVWSTLTAADKAKLTAEPLNNIYLNAAGELLQVRYRVRTIAGLGNDWASVDSESTGNATLRYTDTSQLVVPQGIQTSIATDLGSAAITTPVANRYYDGMADLNTGAGAFQLAYWDGSADVPVVAGESGVGVDGLCFALPIALVQRRNSGAFHDTYNRQGCRRVVGGGLWYGPTGVTNLVSTAACFVPANYVDGTIASTFSGLPNNKFYDAIYATDVTDLRRSAHKVQDYQRTLEREFNKLVDGSFRGWEGEYSGKTPVTATGYNAAAGLGTWVKVHKDNLDPKIRRYDAASTNDLDGINVLVTISGTVVSRAITKVQFESGSGNFLFYFSDGVDESANVDIAAGAIVPFGLGDRSVTGHSAATLMHCDIIGDPAVYPDAWKKYGPPGTALMVHEDGTNLIPNGASKNFKMSRKVASYLTTVFSTDSGVTWTAGNWSAIAGSANEQVGSEAVGLIRMIFYTTKANPLELAVNGEVLALGDIRASAWHGAAHGSTLTSALIGKVPVGTASSFGVIEPLGRRAIVANNGLLDTGVGEAPRHSTIDNIGSTGPASKVLSYLSREAGQAYLNLLYKEMVWDTTMDSGPEFTDRLESSTVATVLGGKYHVTNGSFQGYYIARKVTTVALTDARWSQSAGGIFWEDGLLAFEFWDGNGWGDNNQFSVLDNEDTELDDNGQTILAGTKRVKLPFLTRGDE